MKKLIITVIVFLSSLQIVYSQSGWVIQSSGNLPRLWDSYFIDADTGYAVGVSTVLKTTNGGANWFYLNHGTYFLLWCVQFTNPSTGFAGGQYLIKTTNSGLNWHTKYTNNLLINSMFFLNSNIGWIGGYQGQIIKTTNSGENWINHDINNTSTITDIYFHNSNMGWCVSGNGNIYSTNNGGINWTLLDSTDSDLYAIKFVNESIGWVAGQKIFKTTNGGINWFLQSNEFIYLRNIYIINSLTGYRVGGGGTIIKTTNGGINWISQISGINDFLYSVQFIDMNTGWAVGWSYDFYGTILKTTNGGSTFVFKKNNEIPNIHFLYQNYPNPFNPTTKIKFDLPTSTHAKLIIYDILGREVATLVNEKLCAGSYILDWDGSSYPSGVYFYRLVTMPDGRQAKDFSQTKRMMMVK